MAAASACCGAVLGVPPIMDHGWIPTLADPAAPRAQLSVATHDETAPMVPAVSMQVADLDACHAAAVAAGAEIMHPLTDKTWGVRRSFLLDPDRNVVNVPGHA